MLNQALNIPVGLIHTSWGGSYIEAWMPPATFKDISEKPIPATDTDIKIQNGSPTVLYNGMIYPILGYGIRGVIWYQGEANRNEPALYAKMFDAMVREWCNLWGMGEFPFYYCQIAPYNYGGGTNSGFIREAQAKGMVTILTFDINDYPGLTTYGKELLNFQIAGSNKRFAPAKAAYSGNKVYVFSPAVTNPVAVRYCWDDTSGTELFFFRRQSPRFVLPHRRLGKIIHYKVDFRPILRMLEPS
jgi:hypothetical protein